MAISPARVDERQAQDEIGPLSRAFNRMTGELQRQQRELLEANRELDDRRRFIEAVLSGVPAGVIGLDRNGQIELPNRIAGELLSTELDGLEGQRLDGILPEVGDLMDQARQRPGRVYEQQVILDQPDGGTRMLFARVVAEEDEGGIVGFVVTFDDITELLSAQRKAAWADVARRIAHEIKNPLTPIQLSAERLRRKYLKEIESDQRDLRDLHRHHRAPGRRHRQHGRRVLLLRAHAGAPPSTRRTCGNWSRKHVFLQRSAHPSIGFESSLPEEPVKLVCDRQQIGRDLDEPPAERRRGHRGATQEGRRDAAAGRSEAAPGDRADPDARASRTTAAACPSGSGTA